MGLFGDTFSFPFRSWKRLLWYWLNLIPFLGWILYAGYTADILKRIVDDDADALPPFGEFGATFIVGLQYFVIALLLTIVAEAFLFIPYIGWVFWIALMVLLPFLIAHFAVTRKLGNGFDVVFAFKTVFGNFLKYLWFTLVGIGVLLVLLLCSLPIITLIVTLPAMQVAGQYLYGRFYRETTGAVPKKKPAKRGK